MAKGVSQGIYPETGGYATIGREGMSGDSPSVRCYRRKTMAKQKEKPLYKYRSCGKLCSVTFNNGQCSTCLKERR